VTNYGRVRVIVKAVFVAVAVLFTLLFIISLLTGCGGSTDDQGDQTGATKRTLPRDDIYYEINNDGDDHGNYIETYRIPSPRGTVFCVVYSDQMEGGGGAGIDCDWQGVRQR